MKSRKKKQHFSSYFFPTTSPKTQLLLIAFFLTPTCENDHPDILIRIQVQFNPSGYRSESCFAFSKRRSRAAPLFIFSDWSWWGAASQSHLSVFVTLTYIKVFRGALRRSAATCWREKKKWLQDLDYSEHTGVFVLFINVIIYFFLSYLYLYVWRHVLYFPGLLPLWKL